MYNHFKWKTATGKSVEQNLFSMFTKKEAYLFWIQLTSALPVDQTRKQAPGMAGDLPVM